MYFIELLITFKYVFNILIIKAIEFNGLDEEQIHLNLI